MKIIGFVQNGTRTEMVLKGDSCLLNGRKPMFVPDWTQELGATPCVVLRVSRLGKEIALRFANRYYDAITSGVDFVALDMLREARENGGSWTPAIGFDYSLAIGSWVEITEPIQLEKDLYLITPEEAIVQASRQMTIRQGDLIYIQKKDALELAHKEDIYQAEINGTDVLYCKIK